MYPDVLLADLVFANMCVLAATRTTLQWLPLSMSPYLAFLVYGAVVIITAILILY